MHGARRACRRHLAAVLLIFGFSASMAAAETNVDLQLVLALDASGSVNDRRFELQKRGYAAAFRHPQVIKAIASGAEQSIAVTMVQWTGPFYHVQVIPWTLVKDEASAHALAEMIDESRRELFGGGTSISGAIDHAMTLLSQSAYASRRRTIDVSGDGRSTSGRQVTAARDDAVEAGVTVNGLPILALDMMLDRYYYTSVIGGPGAFMIAAESYEDFADAVRKKLILEIAGDEYAPKMKEWGAVLAEKP